MEQDGWKDRIPQQEQALDFIETLMYCEIPKICLENPIGKISTSICKPHQIIRPWEFGHNENKSTCLWLKNLPKLSPTNIIKGKKINKVHREPPSKNRWKNRSRTYQGIAMAMADQWG